MSAESGQGTAAATAEMRGAPMGAYPTDVAVVRPGPAMPW
jgi:hypothetical protein